MKKLITLFLMILLVFTACDSTTDRETPEQAVHNAVKAIKELDKTTVDKYFNYVDMFENNDSTSNEELKLVVENIRYNILSSNINGNNAVINAEITNIDFVAVMQKYVADAFSVAFSGGDTSDEKMSDLLVSTIKEYKDKTVTKTVEIMLTKGENGWNIDLSNDLKNALLGGLTNLEEDNGFNESYSEDNKDTSDMLYEVDSFIIKDIWNNGFCDISYYISSGTNSIGQTMDIELKMKELKASMSKLKEYNDYITGLEDNIYSELMYVWDKLYIETNSLYDSIKDKMPTANDADANFDVGLLYQYVEAFSNARSKTQ